MQTVKTGAILRIFAKTESVVPEAVNSLRELIEISVCAGLTDHFQVIIAEDTNYPDHDCGLTYAALMPVAAELQHRLGVRVKIDRLQFGDVFVAALNQGIKLLKYDGCTHAFILSKEARSYVDRDTVARMHQAIRHEGVRVAGVVLHEVAELVRKGAVSNPFACWHIDSVNELGGFSKKCAQARIGEERQKVHVFYPESEIDEWAVVQGMEDADLAAAFYLKYGRCIAVVEPASKHATYDTGKDPSRTRRDWLKFLSKDARGKYILKVYRGLKRGFKDLAKAVLIRL